MTAASVLKERQRDVGSEIFVSDWTRVTQGQIDRFADATGDHLWIHMDAKRAAQGPFGATIAHGLFILSLLPLSAIRSPSPRKPLP